MEILNVILMVVSIAVAIIVAMILHRQSKEIASLGAQVGLQIKKDTNELLQVLDNIQFKIMLKKGGQRNISMDDELSRINIFLYSHSSKFIANRLDNLDNKDKKERIGFMLLCDLFLILDRPEDSELVKSATDKLLLLSEKDFEAMDKEARNINKDYFKWFQDRTYFNLFTRKRGDDEAKKKQQESDTIGRFFTRLYEEKHIKDPDVALFYAVFKNDEDLVRKALADGADKTVTDKMLIERYQTEWDEFIRINNNKK